MEQIRREARRDFKKPPGRAKSLLIEGLATVGAIGMLSCSGSAQVSARSSASASAEISFGTYRGRDEGEVRVSRKGDTLKAEVVRIRSITCDNRKNRCNSDTAPVPKADVKFEVLDEEVGRYDPIEGCPAEKGTCDISNIESGALIRVTFKPTAEQTVKGCETRVVK